MFKNRTGLMAIFAIFSLFTGSLAQGAAAPKAADKKDTVASEFKDNSLNYLTETRRLALELISSENRIAYTLRSGHLLWYLNEEQAKENYGYVMGEIRKLAAEADFELNDLEQSSPYDFAKLTLKKTIWLKVSKIKNLASELANSLILHDPEAAYNFFFQLRSSLTNPEMIRNFSINFTEIEINLIMAIAEKDPDRAYKIAIKRLDEKGFFPESIDLMLGLYEKADSRSDKLAQEIIRAIRKPADLTANRGSIERLLRAGGASIDQIQRSKSGKKPLLSKSMMEELADLAFREVANRTIVSLSSAPFDLIKRFLPQRVGEIDKLIKQKENLKKHEQLIFQNPVDKAIREKMEAEQAFLYELAVLTNPVFQKQVTLLKKRELIDLAKKRITTIKDNNFQFLKLIWLGERAINAKENGLAGEILGEAELLLPLNSKVSTDFEAAWILAETYFQIDRNKAFSIVENITSDLNRVSHSYGSIAEFMGGETAIEEGEVKTAASNAMKNIGMENFSRPLIKKLAEKDFERITNLASRFERAEFRLECRIAIAKALLPPPKKK